jgi:single-strand DNA-binding protein
VGSKAGLNRVMLIGNLGADPELRFTKGGTAVVNLSLSCSRSWWDKEKQEKKEETEWIRVTVWGKQGEACKKYLSKGSSAYVEGRLQTTSYDKDGQKHWSTAVVADDVKFLSGSSSSEGGGGGGSTSSRNDQVPPLGDDFGDDGIPF